MSSILDFLKNVSVLTVGDTAADPEHGCIIDFLLEEHKVRFQVNLSAAK